MRAQASYVGVRKTYCYHTDTLTENIQFKGTVDQQNRHKIINRTTSLNRRDKTLTQHNTVHIIAIWSS